MSIPSKATVKKTATKKAVGKKTAGKKVASKKTASKKTATKKVAKKAAKKVAKKASSKVAAKKAAKPSVSKDADNAATPKASKPVIAKKVAKAKVVAKAEKEKAEPPKAKKEKAVKPVVAKEGAAKKVGKAPADAKAIIVPQSEHTVSRESIGRNALKVLNRLHEEGYASYLVGGGVRDALVGLQPKDFDVATNASPEQVKECFKNSRIIGRRFRLVHVLFGREVIEVATFRAAHDKGDGGETEEESGRIVRDNVFGTIDEDALRRDFSVNALYYNIADDSVVDYCDGLKDIDNKLFRLIGDPQVRCEEDPVRVLRAVRLASKLEFDIHKDTLAAMEKTAHLLAQTPPARLFEEVLKLFQGGYAQRSFNAIREHDLLQYLFPMLSERLEDEDELIVQMLDAALRNTDKRVAQNKPITPAYLLAFMLWPEIEEQATALVASGNPANEALHTATDRVMAEQLQVISIPRRFSGPMREIWLLQPRLEHAQGNRALKLMEDRRFRAAYDFLCLRAGVDERLEALADWWTRIQEVGGDKQQSELKNKPRVDSIWGAGSDSSSESNRGNQNHGRRHHGKKAHGKRSHGRKPQGGRSHDGNAHAQGNSGNSQGNAQSQGNSQGARGNGDGHAGGQGSSHGKKPQGKKRWARRRRSGPKNSQGGNGNSSGGGNNSGSHGGNSDGNSNSNGNRNPQASS